MAMLHPLRKIVPVLAGVLVALADTAGLPPQSADTSPLRLERFPLGDVRGRIDHMTIDLTVC
jgi:hypothetical protein